MCVLNIYLCAKDAYEAEYKLVINKKEIDVLNLIRLDFLRSVFSAEGGQLDLHHFIMQELFNIDITLHNS